MEEAVGRILAAIIILWFINLSREPPLDQYQKVLSNLKNETLVFENRTFGVNVSYVSKKASIHVSFCLKTY